MSGPKRFAFARAPGYTRYPYQGDLQCSDGMPVSARRDLSQLLEQYAYTGNKGNLIHGEAPARMFDCDRHQSCYVNLVSLHESGWSPDRIAEAMAARFDMIVFSMANAIQPGFDPEGLLEVVAALKTPFMVLGLGVSESLPDTLESLHPNMVRLLRILDSRASVFGVRGMETQNWLRSCGFSNAQALGCPSMYVYPDAVLQMRELTADGARVATTAGYIHRADARSSALVSLFRDFPAHYIMQTELHALRKRLPRDVPMYDDASGEVDAGILGEVLSDVHQTSMPFMSYRWFQDPGVWRCFLAGTDFYLGDRIHCGIASLQAGVPAIVIEDDLRVRELTDFLQIPVISIHDAAMAEPLELVSEFLSEARLERLKDAYRERFERFRAAMADVEISLTVRIGA